MDVLAAFVLAAGKAVGVQDRLRIYKAELGVRDVLAYEIDFADIAGYDQFWRSWAAGTAPEFFKEYESLIERDLANEIWDRADGCHCANASSELKSYSHQKEQPTCLQDPMTPRC